MASPKPSTSTANTPSSPIFKMDDDLLWRIFSVIANMDEYNEENLRLSASLMTIRTSQVCHYWREVILRSPSLWGRVIDLDFLLGRHPVRRDNILGRTGEAFLHLKCSRPLGAREVTKGFLISLLETYWMRLRVLDLNLHGGDTQFTSKIWRLLQRRTPYLEVCRLSSNDSQFRGPKLALFSNDAPSLREFRSDNIEFSLTSPWISQLRRLEISRYPSMEVFDLRRTLAQMPRLEYLALDRSLGSAWKVSSDPTVIDLPNLHVVVISGQMGTCANILLEVRPHPGCSLHFSSIDELTTNNDVDLARHALRDYSKNYFLSNLATSLSLFVSSRKLELADASPGFPSSGFNVKIYQLRPSLRGAKISSLLGSFRTCNFSNITDLSLKYFPFEVLPSDPNFRGFITSLPSVTVMRTTEQTVEALLSIPETNRIFPMLSTLTIEAMMGEQVPDTSYPTPILHFILRKWRLGNHLKNLNLCPAFEYARDMRSLEAMTGLRVSWNIRCELGSENYREYVCGSGRPKLLDIRCTSETWI